MPKDDFACVLDRQKQAVLKDLFAMADSQEQMVRTFDMLSMHVHIHPVFARAMQNSRHAYFQGIKNMMKIHTENYFCSLVLLRERCKLEQVLLAEQEPGEVREFFYEKHCQYHQLLPRSHFPLKTYDFLGWDVDSETRRPGGSRCFQERTHQAPNQPPGVGVLSPVPYNGPCIDFEAADEEDSATAATEPDGPIHPRRRPTTDGLFGLPSKKTRCF